MPRTGLWLRVFVGLLMAVLPPIVLFVAALIWSQTVLADRSPDLVAIVVVGASIGWAAILAIFFSGRLSEYYRRMLSTARRGDAAAGTDLSDSAVQQLVVSLDERNRQVATLAEQAANVPIDDDPRAVVEALVTAVRGVMRDPTWRCAVLATEQPDLLPTGVYHAARDDEPVGPIGELERWASTAETDRPARHVAGPWGRFTVVDVAVSARLRAILYAPWEGRVDPTPAEFDLLALVGQHAGTALEHSLLYAQVRSQAEELNRLYSVQSDFLRGVTHDLQAPLTSIGALAIEVRASEAVPESARSDLESITHQAERMRRMVSQLLVASRIEVGAITPQQEVFAVPPLIERTWAALRADRPFKLRVTGVPHLAVADPDRLEQVLWAVLDNAVKYSPPASPIEVDVEPRDGWLAVSVRDRGTGMDDATRAHAFDQFYRSEHARKVAPDGSGVGLYAANGLMRAMGGSIEIDSELGQGTRITLAVPAEPSSEAGE